MEGKAVLITGASRGIGKEAALYFAQKGWNVVLNSCHNEQELYETVAEIKKIGGKCLAFCGNAGDYTFVVHMAESMIKEYGRIDCVVNNAGISYVGLLTDMSIMDWNTIVSTNLTSVFNCCNQTVPIMVKQKSGKIINISSVWGEVGASCEVAYSAVKGGINTFTKALAKELAPSNIQVNAIACGLIDTKMNSCFNTEELEDIVNEIPSGRMGTTREVAELIYSLASSNAYLTGQVIRLDGGWI